MRSYFSGSVKSVCSDDMYRMLKYIKVPDDKLYVDLVVSYERVNVVEPNEDTEEMGPPVRYFYNS